jgi:CDP-glucose 4,6-dehydratase
MLTPSFSAAFRDKRVLVTGHTGFKGSWLCEWLLSLGAEVHGFALPPPTTPALFEQLGLADRIARHQIGDVRELAAVEAAVAEARPDFVFHLAAQPLVRLSYSQPVETYATNVMGTVHVLEALRSSGRPCAVVAVTTDKCYENREWLHAYREEDAMGGHDPYSSSKGAAELVISAYRRSFFAESAGIRLASARAGNVIGGGDWAVDRIVPDCVRALSANTPIPVRNKVATRPWQHVLEPLSGYLQLAATLATNQGLPLPPDTYQSGFNFGPALNSNKTVAELVLEILTHWPGTWEDRSDPSAPHEAVKLNLSTDKAFHLLHWEPRWDFQQTIRQTIEWYRSSEACRSTTEFRALTAAQIEAYCTP